MSEIVAQQFRMRTIAFGALLGMSLLSAIPAFALTPQQIFAKDSPSIVVIVAYGADGKPIELGSGVVIAKSEVVTNCHVVKNGTTLQVKQGKAAYPATLHFADSDRDLCQLSVPQLTASPVTMGDARTLLTGADVVPIGAPEGLELTISSGLVSSLRDFGDGTKIIQTSAAISPGSSGGGLFDQGGRLIGITAAYLKEGQNLNFALPVNWVAQLPTHTAAIQSVAITTVDWVTTAAILESSKEWIKLLNYADQWSEAQPQNAEAWFVLGEALAKLDQDTEALKGDEESLRLEPQNPAAWINLGLNYVRKLTRAPSTNRWKFYFWSVRLTGKLTLAFSHCFVSVPCCSGLRAVS